MKIKNTTGLLLGMAGVLAFANSSNGDGWDPGDNTGPGGSVLTMTEAVQVHGPHTMDHNDIADWFQISLTAGNIYHFETTSETAFTDMEGYLYSDSLGLDEVDYAGDIGHPNYHFHMEYTPTNSGVYYLKVQEFFNGSAEYSLNYYFEPGAPGADLDGDGMADVWEIEYFTNTNAMPNAHGDSDTQTNLEEYIAGTDPTNPASYFMITNSSTGSFVVEWPSVTSRVYRVYWAESLTNSFLQQGSAVDYPQNSYTDTIHNTEDSGFYKVDVQLK